MDSIVQNVVTVIMKQSKSTIDTFLLIRAYLQAEYVTYSLAESNIMIVSLKSRTVTKRLEKNWEIVLSNV